MPRLLAGAIAGMLAERAAKGLVRKLRVTLLALNGRLSVT
jgi:hypothetical protein